MSSSKLVVTGASEHGHGKVQEPEDGKGYSTMTLRSLSDLLFSPLFFFYWLQSAAPLKSFNCSLPFGWLFFLFFRGWRVFTLFGPAAFALAVCCGSMTPFPTTWNLQTGCLALLCLFHPVQYALWFSYMSLYNIIYIHVCTCLYCSWTLARSPRVSLKFSFIQHWISWTYFGRTAFHILSFIWLKAHSDSCFFVDCVYVYSLYVYIYIHMTHTHHCSLFGFYVNHISCSFFRLPLKKLI